MGNIFSFGAGASKLKDVHNIVETTRQRIAYEDKGIKVGKVELKGNSYKPQGDEVDIVTGRNVYIGYIKDEG